MKNSIKKDLMNNDIITRKYTTEVQGSIFAIAFKCIKFRLVKTVEVEADIVDTVPGSRRIGWTTVMPVYEYEYEGQVYRNQSYMYEYNSEQDVPNTMMLKININNPFEFMEVGNVKISGWLSGFVSYVLLMIVVIFVYLLIVNNM